MMRLSEIDQISINDLPNVRGRIKVNARLAQGTWFRVGGPSEILFEPADTADLAWFLDNLDPGVPVTIIGRGSNVIIRDGGIPGVTVKLGRPFSEIRVNPVKCEVIAGGSAVDAALSRAAQRSGISGFEFLSGIPGTIGGAIRMNAGAYNTEFSEVLSEITAVSLSGKILTVDRKKMNFAYRFVDAPDDWIFVSAKLQGEPDDPIAIRERMLEISIAREGSQPTKKRTGGSTFKNPPGSKAWELIDSAGCRGLVRGGAKVSCKHSNFLLNSGNASASDLENLGEEVREKVFDTHGICLEWEIRRLGLHKAASRKRGNQ